MALTGADMNIALCDMDREELIGHYFTLGFAYQEIVMFLHAIHGFTVSLRQLKRILRSLNLYRRKHKHDINIVARSVEEELNGSGINLGYRSMHRRLMQMHGIVTDRETVRLVMKHLDPDGVMSRIQRRLSRRDYSVKGPNYLWHVDGWDKLKLFGFSIHGCIDGFSRKIIWLEVAASNKDPYMIGTYFVNAVTALNGVAYIVRADRGTENVNIEILQQILRTTHDDERARSDTTFLYGKSTANQRIEAWWSKFPQQGMAFWIHHFQEFVHMGIMDTSCHINIQCARFCYMNLLRQELLSTMQLWNTHHIRKSRNLDSPHGKPETMYNFPEVYGCRDYLRRVNEEDVLSLTEALTGHVPDCEEPALELFTIMMEEHNRHMPTSVSEGDDLFVFLLDTMHNY